MVSKSLIREIRRSWGPMPLITNWFSTRKWRFLFGGIPAALLIIGGVFLFAEVNRRNDRELLSHYISSAFKALDKGDSAAASLLFRRAQLLSPGNSEAKFGAALAAEKEGDLARAEQMMTIIASTNDDASTKANFWLVQKMMAKKDATQEEKLSVVPRLEKILEHQPRHTDARVLLSQYFLVAGFPDKSIDHLRIAAEERPQLQLTLAMLYAQNKQSDLSEIAAKRATALFMDKVAKDPRDQEVRIQLSAALAMQKKFAEAIATLREGLKAEKSEELTKQLSLTYTGWANHIRATNADDTLLLDMLSNALRLDPQNTHALLLLLQMSKDASDNGVEAKKILEERLASGQAPWVIHLILGTTAVSEDDKAQAASHLEQALAQNSKVPATLNNLAWLLAYQPEPDLDRALTLAEEAVKLAPGSPQIRETRGQILIKLGRWQDALTDLESVLPIFTNSQQLKPQLASLHQSIAVAYENLDNASMAERHRDMVKKYGGVPVTGAPAEKQASPPVIEDSPAEAPTDDTPPVVPAETEEPATPDSETVPTGTNSEP